METTGQSEKLREAAALEEHNSDPGEEQSSSQEQETAPEEEATSAPEATKADTTSEAGSAEAAAPRRKKRRKKAEAEPFDEKSASPRPSYWPIVLAFSLCVMFLGVAWHPVMMGIGVILVVISLIAWSLERR